MVTLLLVSAIVSGQSVSVQNGNIFITERGVTSRAITDSGKDSEPSLSVDGKRVVFLRAIEEAEGVGVPRVVVNELWTATEMESPKRVYSGLIVLPDGTKSKGFSHPRFSPDNQRIYFLVDYSATYPALCKLDIGSAQAQFLSPAVDFAVLQAGSHKGFIVAAIRSLSEPDTGGDRFPIYPYYLLRPDGSRESRIADEDARIEDVVEKYSL